MLDELLEVIDDLEDYEG